MIIAIKVISNRYTKQYFSVMIVAIKVIINRYTSNYITL